MARQSRRWFLSGLIAIAVCAGARDIGTAMAQDIPCVDYRTRDHWLPNPHGTSSTPLKVASWQGMLVTLRPEGLEITGLDDPLAPAAAGRIVGTFSDFALGPDYVVLGSAGRLQGFDLPGLAPRFSYQEGSASLPRLACRDTMVVAAFGRQLKIFTNADPEVLTPLGAYEVPQYNSVIGLGSLQISGDHVLGCAGGGNNIAGYYGALTVVDITDPALPRMTDRVSFAPGDPDSASTLFFEAQPHGPGFVVSGLGISNGLRPEYNDRNRQFLARFTIDEGRIVWHGLAEVSGPMTSGFTINGSRALWTISPISSYGYGMAYVVDLDWAHSSPQFTYADHHFLAGKMCWLSDRATLSSGPHLYHLEALRTISNSTGYTIPDPEYRNVRSVGDRTVVAWRESTVQVDRSLWAHGFFISTYDLSGAAPTLRGRYKTPFSVYDDDFDVAGCAVMGPHVFFTLTRMPIQPPNASYRMDIDATSLPSEPMITANETIRCAIPWDEHFVMATADSLEICSVDASGGISTVGALRHTSAYGADMVRIGNLLLLKNKVSGTPAPTVSIFDLSDITAPRLLTTSSGWHAYLAYVPEAGLLFDFGLGGLRWQTVAADGTRTIIGSWSKPFPGTIYDLCLRGDVLYLALGGCGLGVYEFDPVSGLAPAGGDLGSGTYTGLAPVRILPQGSGGLLLSPGMVVVGPDCRDPLPVFASGFRAQRLREGVNLSWRCRTTGAVSGVFEVWREEEGRERLVGRQPATPGEHEMLDPAAVTSDGVRYGLYLSTGYRSRLLLDATAPVTGPQVTVTTPPTAAPNPFNAGTTITFDLPRDGQVRIAVHDLAGRLIATLVDGAQAQGRHEVAWNGRDSRGRAVGSGVYLARVELPGRTWNLRLGLVK